MASLNRRARMWMWIAERAWLPLRWRIAAGVRSLRANPGLFNGRSFTVTLKSE